MKKIFTLLAGMMLCTPAFARTFTYFFEGNALIYEVTDEDEKTCRVAENKYVYDALIIPDVASDGQNEYRVTAIGGGAFYYTSITSVDIPHTVKKIGNMAFYGCDGIEDLVIPGNVEEIGEAAFMFCIKLKNVFLSDGVTIVNKESFRDCTKIETIRFSNTLNKIGSNAFRNCSSLKSIEIPNSVTTIGESAFNDCGTMTKAVIGDGTTNLGSYSFYGCRALSELTLGNSLTTIGSYVFTNCDNLESITLPSSVTSVGYYAFSYCDNLMKITLSESLSSFGWSILLDCYKLQVIENPSPTPLPFSEVYPFTDENYRNATLYVPVGSLAAYRTTLPWSPFRTIKETDFSGIEETIADTAEIDLNSPCEIFDLSGRRVSAPVEDLSTGIYILRQGNAVKKHIVR